MKKTPSTKKEPPFYTETYKGTFKNTVVADADVRRKGFKKEVGVLRLNPTGKNSLDIVVTKVDPRHVHYDKDEVLKDLRRQGATAREMKRLSKELGRM